MVSEITKDDYIKYVGVNAYYYLKKWGMLTNVKSGNGTNWHAFFLGVAWFIYRKMYHVAIMLMGILAVESILSNIIFLNVLGYEEIPGFYNAITTVIFCSVCGGCGNYWYYCWRRKEG